MEQSNGDAPADKGVKIKYIDILAEGKFEANGKVYFLEPHISVDRYRHMTKLELEISFSTNFKKHYAGLQRTYDLLNKNKLADASVAVRDTLESLKRLDDLNDPHP